MAMMAVAIHQEAVHRDRDLDMALPQKSHLFQWSTMKSLLHLEDLLMLLGLRLSLLIQTKS